MLLEGLRGAIRIVGEPWEWRGHLGQHRMRRVSE